MGFFDKISNLLNVNLSDDELDADFEEEEVKRVEREQRTASRPERVERPKNASQDYNHQNGYSMKAHASTYNSTTYVEKSNNMKSLRMERPEGSKIIPICDTFKGEVCIMKPMNFEESQDICDVLLSERMAIVNLEGQDLNLSQRIMDFLSGTIYSINGKLFQIAGMVFIVAPESINITSDDASMLAKSGFDIPTFKNGN